MCVCGYSSILIKLSSSNRRGWIVGSPPCRLTLSKPSSAFWTRNLTRSEYTTLSDFANGEPTTQKPHFSLQRSVMCRLSCFTSGHPNPELLEGLVEHSGCVRQRTDPVRVRGLPGERFGPGRLVVQEPGQAVGHRLLVEDLGLGDRSGVGVVRQQRGEELVVAERPEPEWVQRHGIGQVLAYHRREPAEVGIGLLRVFGVGDVEPVAQ